MAYIRDHILHVFFQFHLKYILLFFFKIARKNQLKKQKTEAFVLGQRICF